MLAMFQQASEKKGEKIRHANRGNRISLLNDAEAPSSKRVGRVYLVWLAAHFVDSPVVWSTKRYSPGQR